VHRQIVTIFHQPIPIPRPGQTKPNTTAEAHTQPKKKQTLALNCKIQQGSKKKTKFKHARRPAFVDLAPPQENVTTRLYRSTWITDTDTDCPYVVRFPRLPTRALQKSEAARAPRSLHGDRVLIGGRG